ncbi:MAG TPA: DUF362 domain-containing protein [Methanoregulaceae archaeon]|nr:DUF362 domain-containing protein [Methanoregulaceae archaeon]
MVTTKAAVYFASLRARAPYDSTVSKVGRLFDEAGFGECIGKNALTAIKLHFGEMGNDSYINPVFVREVVDRVRKCGGKPFLTDSNTLYLGSRSNAVDHIETAIRHGFDYAVAGAPLIIADGLSGGNTRSVSIDKNHFAEVIISGDIVASDSLLVLSHFKGHEVAGFGGAIKNLAMGCASARGKQEQHSARPLVIKAHCIGCGKCTVVCPKSAISLKRKKSHIDRELCIGCFECMTVCSQHAIDIDWETEIPRFVERLVEYAFGAIQGKERRLCCMNFLTRITPDCDCVPWSDAPIVPDIGILASKDPVAIDAASFDLVNGQAAIPGSLLTRNHRKGADKFKGLRAGTDAFRQVTYGEEIGLGTSEYKLIDIQGEIEK